MRPVVHTALLSLTLALIGCTNDSPGTQGGGTMLAPAPSLDVVTPERVVTSSIRLRHDVGAELHFNGVWPDYKMIRVDVTRGGVGPEESTFLVVAFYLPGSPDNIWQGYIPNADYEAPSGRTAGVHRLSTTLPHGAIDVTWTPSENFWGELSGTRSHSTSLCPSAGYILTVIENGPEWYRSAAIEGTVYGHDVTATEPSNRGGTLTWTRGAHREIQLQECD